MDLHDRITTDPAVCHGQACISGTRIPVRSFPYTVIYEAATTSSAPAPPPVVGFDLAAVYCRGSAPPATGDT